MHYYFHTKEQVYDSLQEEAYSTLSDCIAQAQRENTLLKQLSTFVAAAQRSNLADRSMMRFIITSRLELHRNPNLRGGSTPASEAVVEFPRLPAAVAVDEFARTWPGLALVLDVPAGQPFIAGNGAKPIVVTGDFTGERVRSELYRDFDVDSFIEGVGRFESLDEAARPAARSDVS
jgi:AcrR family transcriptional regulator